MQTLAPNSFCPLTNPQPYQRERAEPPLARASVANTGNCLIKSSVRIATASGWLERLVRSFGRAQQQERRDICDHKKCGLHSNRDGCPKCVWRLDCVVRMQDWLQVGRENITAEKVSEQRTSNDAKNRAKAGVPTRHRKCGTDDKQRGADECDEEMDG